MQSALALQASRRPAPTGVVQDALGGGGLARVNVGHDTDVAVHVERHGALACDRGSSGAGSAAGTQGRASRQRPSAPRRRRRRPIAPSCRQPAPRLAGLLACWRPSGRNLGSVGGTVLTGHSNHGRLARPARTGARRLPQQAIDALQSNGRTRIVGSCGCPGGTAGARPCGATGSRLPARGHQRP